MFNLDKILSDIKPTDKEAFAAAQDRLNSLVKPPGSLGTLEEISAQLSAITGDLYPDIEKRCVIIMASDNGVVDEGVASAPQSVTLAQTINFTKGITGVAALAKRTGTDLMIVDVGINADIAHPDIINMKIRKSTGNIYKEPAMTRDEAIKAIEVGYNCLKTAKEKGYRLIGVGEMGIGNTTTSSAVLCALLGYSGEDIKKTAGRGAGLTDEGYAKKLHVIDTALSLHNPVKSDPIDILSKVGGFDIAAMCGVYIAAAYYKLPVVIDGFISAVAALCAVSLVPVASEYMFASHFSRERGYSAAINELGMKPALHLGMRLGEGSGCPIMFTVMDAACVIMRDMATFAEAEIDEEYLNNIKDKRIF